MFDTKLIKTILNRKIIPLLIAIIHFAITTTCKIDKVFFNYPNIETDHMIIIKILYALFLLLGYTFIFNVVRKIKEKDKFYIRGLKLFSIYFSILFILILLVWPGLWAWDDVWVLTSDVNYTYNAWQHILTSFKDLIFLQVLPFTTGIIILQNIIIAICVAFSIIKLENTYNIFFKNKILDYIFKLLPFLLLPVLRYQLSGYRIGLYVYLEVVMLVILLCAIKNKEIWNVHYASLFVFLTIICTVWRTESLLYMPVILLLLFFMKHIGSLKKRLLIILFIVADIIGINAEQKHYLGNSNYEIVSTLRQCTQLIRSSDKNKDAELLKDIDKVVNIKIIYDNPNLNGEELYWQKKIVQNNYTKVDYKRYLTALSKLSLKYPIVLIKERTDLFILSAGLKGDTNTNASLYSYIIHLLTNDKNLNATSPFFISLGDKFVLNKPINKTVRREVARIITLNHNDFLFRIVWNFIPPMIVLFVTWFILLFKRYWKEFILCSAIIGKIFIVILTAPAPWIMYYLSFYLIGYVILIYWLIYIFTLKKGGKYE